MTLGLLPSQAHVIWRDSVSVQAQCQDSKTEFAGILQQDQQSLSVPCTVLTSTKKGRNSCLRLLPRFRCRLDVLQIEFSRGTISFAEFSVFNPCLIGIFLKGINLITLSDFD